MADSMNKELFLDILTKDEREALLTKKMEEIRKKNEALRKRHEEIEADKRVAAKDNPNKDVNLYSREAEHSGSSSPRKESKPLPGEEKRGPRPSKSGGRGRPQGGGKSKEKRPQQGVFRVIRWEPHTGEVDVTGDDDANDGGDEQDGRRNTNPRAPSDHTIDSQQGNDVEDGEVEVKRFRPKRNRRIASAASEDSEEGTGRHGGHYMPSNRPPRISGMLGPEDGPPPDPSYNFLADRRREGMSKEAPSNMEYHGEKSPHKGETRRHPKNYGGQDFNNVKAQIRSSKERQERPKSGPPRTKMELAMSMTGKERKQYMEWKAERERVDLERLERQKSNTGEWRRAWDADKNQQDFEQPPSPQRTEPAKRPAGRIGSGRFDRGEREERQRGDAPRQKAGVKTEQEAQAKPIGRGRARGRGRGRGRGERSPRQRTFSSGDESRKVERQKDLLVVKIDNSGKDINQSVEVEYWDDDLVDVKSNSAASVKSATSSRDGHSNHARSRRHDDHQFDDLEDGQDGDNGYVGGQRKHTQSLSLGDENEHDESWEDCPEDAEFYTEEEHADGDDRYKEPLKLECKLNPDAPEFTPTSPDFMKTPPGHVKVMDWVTEVNSNLSPTSPPPTMDGVNNEECKKALFKDSKSNSAEKKKSSSNGGVTKTSEEELSASYTEDNEPGNTAAPEASEEFLDASGDMGEHDESREADQDGKQEAESLSVSGKSEEEEVEPSPQKENKTPDQNELPEAELSAQTGVDNEPSIEMEEAGINSESSGESEKTEGLPEKADSNTQGPSEAESEDTAIYTKPIVNTDNVDNKSSEKTEDPRQTNDSDTQDPDADALNKPTDVTTEQMAKSDLTSQSEQSDHTVQSELLVKESEPTEDNQKSSTEETEVETVSSPPTTTTTAAVENSHVE